MSEVKIAVKGGNRRPSILLSVVAFVAEWKLLVAGLLSGGVYHR